VTAAVGVPGFEGSLASYAVRVVAIPLPFALLALLEPSAGLVDRTFGALFAMMIGPLMAGIYGLPGGSAGGLLAHVAVRRVPSQTAHVAAFAAAGALEGRAHDVLLLDSTWTWLPVVVGAATAVGRLAALPLVRRAA
jgi:hypothetical protein